VLADFEPMPDPLERYHRVSSDIELHSAVVKRLAREREACVVILHDAGSSYASIAGTTGLSRARVQQLVERGRRV
jgi:DNA-directed RNA polymerase specialized sigma24 family protein